MFARFVDPDPPDDHPLTWCGRFSIPFGLLLLESTARGLALGAPAGHPVAYGTSVGFPELPVRDAGLGPTALANLFHFAGYPAVVYSAQPVGQ